MKPDRADAVLLLGGALVTTGAALIYRPAGFIVAGLLMLLFGYSMAATMPRKEG